MIGHRGGVNVRSQEGSGRLPAPKSGAKPKGRNLTPPEVTGEGTYVSGDMQLFIFENIHQNDLADEKQAILQII